MQEPDLPEYDCCDNCRAEFELDELEECGICFQEFCVECLDDHIC